MKTDEKSIGNAGWISLGKGEDLEAWSHPSIYLHLPMYIVGGFLIIAGFFAPFVVPGTAGWFSLLLIPLGALLIGVEYLRYISEFYVFTDSRIIKKQGILSHNVTKVAYRNIDNLEKEYPIKGRILGYGNLEVVTASPSDSDIRMDYLPQLNEATSIIGDYRARVTDSMMNSGSNASDGNADNKSENS